MSTHDIIVIGSGISGMSFAHYAAQSGASVMVLEASDSLGGCIQSWRVDVDGTYWTELGAHTCYNSYGNLLELLEARRLASTITPRAKVPFKLLIDGEVRSIASEIRIPQLLLAAPRLFFTSKKGRTVRDYYGRIVGAGNYERVFGPVFTAVPSQPADDFPAEMLFKTRPRRRDVRRSFTLAGGLSSIVEAIGADERINVALGREVTAITGEAGGRLSVRLRDGASETARHVCVATSPSAASRLLSEVAPEVAALCGGIRVVSVETVGVIVPAAATPLPRFAGIIPIGGRFYSAVSRDTVPDERHRGFAFHAAPGDSVEARLADIARVLKVSPGAMQHHKRREVLLPSPVLGHPERAAAIDRALIARGDSLFVTGNYFGGLSLEDCVTRSRAEAARLGRT